MKKYNPNLEQFKLKDSSLLHSPNEEIEGYVPKMFVKYNHELDALEESNSADFEYLLKFSHDIVLSHSENEHFFLWLSKQCDIKTANTFLIKENEDYLLLSQRFTNEDTNIIHLKDILSSDERKGVTLPRIYEILDNLDYLSEDKKEDIKLGFFKQVLFSNSVGNYDLNYGNIGFLGDKNLKICDIAPAYDITSTYIFDSFKKSNIIVNSKNLDVTARDIIQDSLPFIDNKKLLDAVANITFKLNDNFKEIKNSYIPQINDLKNLQEIDILNETYVEDELKDNDMVLTYKHIQNKIHSLNTICKENCYEYVSEENDPTYLNKIVNDYENKHSINVSENIQSDENLADSSQSKIKKYR